ncbi:HIT domain-containing protein [Candidatus Pacearchaeota archaeon]|nr:HIT domain-containing protein [Candidatus Pacearchaeota archaeon]
MALTKKQIAEAKSQLSAQIQNLTPSQREEAQKQIDSLSDEAIEEMIAQQTGKQEIFRMIASKKVDSVIVDENSDAIAVLSIRALSKGHCLVIPKEVVREKDKMPKKIIDFAVAVGKKIQDSLKPKKLDVKKEEKFGEIVLEVVPDYGEKLAEKEVSKSELENVLKEINVIKIEKKVEKIRKKKSAPVKLLKLKRRIP